MFQLRNLADIRTLFALGLMIAVFAVLWLHGMNSDAAVPFWSTVFRDPGAVWASLWDVNWALTGPLLGVLCFLGIMDAVISHNHNHVPIFKDKWSNIGVGFVISFFYGYPCFAWIPTHNMNHHHFNNKPGDYSITTRPFRKVGLLAVATYPTVTSLTQVRLLKPFLAKCWKQNRFIFWRAIAEYAFFYGVMIALFLIDWRKALLFALIPQQVALFVIQHFNYLQHIETDSYSEYNHSRNFTGWMLNFLLFNNGFHTVHHDKPGMHWSESPKAHAEIADKIDPRLQQKSFWGFWFGRFVVRPLLGKSPQAKTLPADLTAATLEDSPEARTKLKAEYESYRASGSSGNAAPA